MAETRLEVTIAAQQTITSTLAAAVGPLQNLGAALSASFAPVITAINEIVAAIKGVAAPAAAAGAQVSTSLVQGFTNAQAGAAQVQQAAQTSMASVAQGAATAGASVQQTVGAFQAAGNAAATAGQAGQAALGQVVQGSGTAQAAVSHVGTAFTQSQQAATQAGTVSEKALAAVKTAAERVGGQIAGSSQQGAASLALVANSAGGVTISFKTAGDAARFYGDLAKQAGDKAKTSLTETNQGLELVKKGWQLLAGAVTVVVGAFQKVLDLGISLVQDFAGSEAATLRLTAALRAQGDASQETLDKTIGLARSFAQEFGFAQTNTEAMLQRLIAFGRVAPESLGAVGRATLDLAAQMGVGLEEASAHVARATAAVNQGVAGQTVSLRGLKIEFETTGNPAKDLARLMEELASRTAGSAELMKNSASTALRTLKERWSEVRENLGQKLFESEPIQQAFRAVIGSVNSLVDAVANLSQQDVDVWAERIVIAFRDIIVVAGQVAKVIVTVGSKIAALFNLGNQFRKWNVEDTLFRLTDSMETVRRLLVIKQAEYQKIFGSIVELPAGTANFSEWANSLKIGFTAGATEAGTLAARIIQLSAEQELLTTKIAHYQGAVASATAAVNSFDAALKDTSSLIQDTIDAATAAATGVLAGKAISIPVKLDPKVVAQQQDLSTQVNVPVEVVAKYLLDKERSAATVNALKGDIAALVDFATALGLPISTVAQFVLQQGPTEASLEAMKAELAAISATAVALDLPVQVVAQMFFNRTDAAAKLMQEVGKFRQDAERELESGPPIRADLSVEITTSFGALSSAAEQLAKSGAISTATLRQMNDAMRALASPTSADLERQIVAIADAMAPDGKTSAEELKKMILELGESIKSIAELQFDQVIRDQTLEVEKLDAAFRAGKITLDEYKASLGAISDGALPKFQKAAVAGSQSAQQAVHQLTIEQAQLTEQIRQSNEAAAQPFRGDTQNFLGDMLKGDKGFKQAFHDFGQDAKNSFVDSFTENLTDQLFKGEMFGKGSSINDAIGGLFSSGTTDASGRTQGQGAFSQMFGSIFGGTTNAVPAAAAATGEAAEIGPAIDAITSGGEALSTGAEAVTKGGTDVSSAASKGLSSASTPVQTNTTNILISLITPMSAGTVTIGTSILTPVLTLNTIINAAAATVFSAITFMIIPVVGSVSANSALAVLIGICGIVTSAAYGVGIGLAETVYVAALAMGISTAYVIMLEGVKLMAVGGFVQAMVIVDVGEARFASILGAILVANINNAEFTGTVIGGGGGGGGGGDFFSKAGKFLGGGGLFAEGGIATKPTRGTFGERGAEVLLPLDRLQQFLRPQVTVKPPVVRSKPEIDTAKMADAFADAVGKDLARALDPMRKAADLLSKLPKDLTRTLTIAVRPRAAVPDVRRGSERDADPLREAARLLGRLPADMTRAMARVQPPDIELPDVRKEDARERTALGEVTRSLSRLPADMTRSLARIQPPEIELPAISRDDAREQGVMRDVAKSLARMPADLSRTVARIPKPKIELPEVEKKDARDNAPFADAARSLSRLPADLARAMVRAPKPTIDFPDVGEEIGQRLGPLSSAARSLSALPASLTRSLTLASRVQPKIDFPDIGAEIGSALQTLPGLQAATSAFTDAVRGLNVESPLASLRLEPPRIHELTPPSVADIEPPVSTRKDFLGSGQAGLRESRGGSPITNNIHIHATITQEDAEDPFAARDAADKWSKIVGQQMSRNLAQAGVDQSSVPAGIIVDRRPIAANRKRRT